MNVRHLEAFPVLESRIDWITGTVGPGIRASVLSSRVQEWQVDRARDGYRCREFRWSGYFGEAVDGITIGSRDDGTIIRLSGECAHKHGLTALTFVSNVSRIDLQVTLQSPDRNLNLAERCLTDAHFDKRVEAGITRTSIIRSTPRGTTAYIGSRSSDRYFRVYDKTAESDGIYPETCWRYEVEYKKDRAWRVAQEILRCKGSPGGTRSIVEQAFADYGVELPCLALPLGWRDAGIHAESNDERRLAWLTKSIRPMLAKLLEGVPYDQVMTALGIDGYINPVTGEISRSGNQLAGEQQSLPPSERDVDLSQIGRG